MFFFNIFKLITLKLNFDKSEDVIFEKNDNVECIICLDYIVKGKILRCSHIFHKNCLFFWIINDDIKKCPICKKIINFNKRAKRVNFNKNKNNMSQLLYNTLKYNDEIPLSLYLNYHKIKRKVYSILN